MGSNVKRSNNIIKITQFKMKIDVHMEKLSLGNSLFASYQLLPRIVIRTFSVPKTDFFSLQSIFEGPNVYIMVIIC